MRKAFILFSFKAIGALSSLILGMIISRFYGVDIFGDYGILLSYVTIFSLFATWGLNIYIIEHRIMKISGDLLKFWLLISLFFSIIASLLFYIKFNNFYLGITVLLLSILAIQGAFLMLLNKQYYNSLLNDFLKYIVPIIFVYFGYYFFNEKSFFNIYLISQIFLLIVCLFSFIKLVNYEKKSINIKLNDFLFYGGIPTASALLLLLNAQFDRLILSQIVSKEMIGVYFAAQSLMALISYATISVMMVITPQLVKLYKEKDFLNLSKLSRKYCILLISFSTFVLLLSVFFSNIYFNFYGIKNIEGYYCILILLSGVTLSQFFGFGMTISIYTEYKKKLLYYQLFVFIISSILCFLLSKEYGIIGASISTSTGIVLIKFLIWLDYKKRNIKVGII